MIRCTVRGSYVRWSWGYRRAFACALGPTMRRCSKVVWLSKPPDQNSWALNKHTSLVRCENSTLVAEDNWQKMIMHFVMLRNKDKEVRVGLQRDWTEHIRKDMFYITEAAKYENNNHLLWFAINTLRCYVSINPKYSIPILRPSHTMAQPPTNESRDAKQVANIDTSSSRSVYYITSIAKSSSK